jgi:hypothetical protein
MTAIPPRILPAAPAQVSLAAYHAAPDARTAYRRWARMLFEQAQLMERADPFAAAEARCAAAALQGLADKPPPAPEASELPPPPPPAPRAPRKCLTGRDKRAARLRVDEWLLRRFTDDDRPSLRQARATADAEGIGPRSLVDKAYRARWPLPAAEACGEVSKDMCCS